MRRPFFQRLAGRLRRLRDDRRGASLLVTAIALPVIVGSMGLAVDAYQWTVTKRQIQQSADSAAIAGAYAAVQGTDVDAAVSDAAAASTGAGASVTATLSPEGHDGDPYAVGVEITEPGAMFFTSLFMKHPIAITARATATVAEAGNFCVYALGSDDPSGIELKRDTTVEADCRMATNAGGPAAVTADPSAKLAAERLLAFGGIGGGGAMDSANMRAFAMKQKDPMRGVDMPEIPNSGCPNITLNNDYQGGSVKPGCFGNLVINGRVDLEPGNYILNRGNLLIGPSASITCDGCSFFLTSDGEGGDDHSIGRVKIDPGASVDLTAPRDGDYAGVLMYQDRRASEDDKDQESSIAASASSHLNGILYFPSRPLTVTGDGSKTFGCARLIGRRLMFEGHVILSRGCSTDEGKIILSGAEVRLVD